MPLSRPVTFAVPKATRVYSAADNFISIPTGGGGTAIPFATEVADNDSIHGTAATSLTGTVAKTASANTLVGTSTLFTTELAIGDAIMVPGTANEFAVVTGITDNTHLTVNQNWTNTASGQTARKANESLVCRTAANYDIIGIVTFGVSATGIRNAFVQKNRSTVWDVSVPALSGAGNSTAVPFVFSTDLAQYDHLEVFAFQDSGSSVNLRGLVQKTTVIMKQAGAAGSGI